VRLGLIVNPVAGVGGPLALKGSDGAIPAHLAAGAGVPSLTSTRAATALAALAGHPCTIVTSAGAMGEDAARQASLSVQVVHAPATNPSAPSDTVAAAGAIAAAGVDLLAFAGGDGTARDLLAANLGSLPMLGIPAGVKMHSAAFATSPGTAGTILRHWLQGHGRPPVVADVMDRDDQGAITLYGAMPIPRSRGMQAAKATLAGSAAADLERAAAALSRELRDEPLAVIGPGATMMMVKQALAGQGTLLGVDAYAHGEPVAIDADAQALRALAAATPPRLVLGVIGGQGFLLGRGNQQIDAVVIACARQKGLTVLADAAKLVALHDATLLVDSGDASLDRELESYLRVHVAPGRSMMMKVRAA
jgi:predicted polyphosphate/ATP-dependent NAD kinase